MTKTDLDLLVQACRNVKGRDVWQRLQPGKALLHHNRVSVILKEYNRLLRLKKKRKKAA
jgi:hypothetical protein